MTQLTAPDGPARARLGVTALICALLPFAWVLIVGVLIGVSTGSNDTLASLATVMFFASFGVVPLFSLLALVLAVLALLVNTVTGKVLGGVAILLLAIQVALIVYLVGGSFDLPAQALAG